MKNRLVPSFGLFGALALLGACGSSPGGIERLADSDAAIVNGQLDGGDPAVVYIDVGCSGTLVSPRVVLTACHCMENRNSANVFFGSNINQSGTWISSAHVQVMNPNQCVGDGDIAMITLSQDGPADPIPVNDRNLSTSLGNDVRLVGFGVVGGNSGGSGTKREGGTKLHDLEPGVMWVGGQSAGFCYGDSGGPNFMVFDGVEHVAGVTSFTTANCSGVGNDGSARTDTYFSFIASYIADHDPASCDEDGRCGEGCGEVDPDCPCADDGICSELCSDLASDVDCDGCGADGVCREDCPVVDGDCCAADGECFDACGALDPDCGPQEPVDPGNGNGNGDGDGDGDGDGSGQGSGNANAVGDDVDAGGLTGSVTCAMPRGALPAAPSVWMLGALAALALSRRRARGW